MNTTFSRLFTIIAFVVGFNAPAQAQANTKLQPARVTVIYDAFGKPSDLERGWGYSALVEYGGRRILFDTGGQYYVFARNVKRLGIDLTHLDFVVVSHRHGDHTGGLAYVLKQNPGVKVYAPREAGSFGTPVAGSTGQGISHMVEGIAGDLHYFDGKIPAVIPVDSPWPGVNIGLIDKTVEVLPGVFLFRTVSDVPGTLELNEISMAVTTPQGLVVVVGCSHPGIEKILTAASSIAPHLYTVVGGLHLLDKPDVDVSEVVTRLRGHWKLEHAAAGHCTGEFAQTELERVFGANHDHAGLGAVIQLPHI